MVSMSKVSDSDFVMTQSHLDTVLLYFAVIKLQLLPLAITTPSLAGLQTFARISEL